MPDNRLNRRTDLALALGGPAALGALLGSPSGFTGLLAEGARLPALTVGVSVLMAPALYIGTARIGLTGIGLKEIASASAEALVRAGRIMLGVLPVVAFLGVACTSAFPMVASGSVLLGIAALVGLRHFQQTLLLPRSLPLPSGAVVMSTESSFQARALFGAWLFVTIAIAATAFFHTL